MFNPSEFSPQAYAIPISMENPSGQNPRELPVKTSLYAKIKTLRNQCRAKERSSLDTEDHQKLLVQWKSIVEFSSTLLREQAKDIEVSAWLIEGLTRLYGFEGLHAGFEITHTILEKFWPGVYPQDEEGDVHTTLAPLSGLNGERNNGTLITPINCIPLLYFNDIPLASWQYQQVIRPTHTVTENTDNTLTLEHFQQAAITAGWKPLKTLKHHIQSCLDTYEKLCNLLDEKCGQEESPPRSNIRNALNEVITIVEALQQFAPEPPPAENTANSPNSSENAVTSSAGLNRQKAFQDMQIIANYFREHEPNSPIPFLLEQAIRWGNLSLPQLLSELVQDEQALLHSYKLIGAAQK